MTITFAPEPCPVCEGGMWRPHIDGTYQFRHGRRSYSVAGQHYALCDKCGTRGYLPGQRDANRDSIRNFQRTLSGFISAYDVLAVREKYLLTQEQAGLIFGGGKRAFSKWECGKSAPAGPTARLLKLALKYPDVMNTLAQEAGIQLLEPPTHDRRIADKKELYRFEAALQLHEIKESVDVMIVLVDQSGSFNLREGLKRRSPVKPMFGSLGGKNWSLITAREATYKSTSVSGQKPSSTDEAPQDEFHIF